MNRILCIVGKQKLLVCIDIMGSSKKEVRKSDLRGVKQKRTHANIGNGRGGQAKVNVHIWFKI